MKTTKLIITALFMAFIGSEVFAQTNTPVTPQQNQNGGVPQNNNRTNGTPQKNNNNGTNTPAQQKKNNTSGTNKTNKNGTDKSKQKTPSTYGPTGPTGK